MREQIFNWINSISNEEQPAQDIIAFNFGIFEKGIAYMMYVTGSKEYFEHDSDWTNEEDFVPKQKYLPLTGSENFVWEDLLDKVEAALKEYVSSEQFKNSFLKDAKFITTGFDDGDLVRVK